MSGVLRSRYGIGYSPTAPTEKQYVVGSARAWSGKGVPIIVAHGAGTDASGFYSNGDYRKVMNLFARFGLVIAADLGNKAWGNDIHSTRIEEARLHLEKLGVTGPVGLFGISMGCLGVTNYTYANPTKVKFVGSAIGCVSLQEFYDNQPAYQADINAAYGGAYNDATHGVDHNPINYASKLDPKIPIHITGASDDTAIPVATHEAFIAARPDTKYTSVGDLSHTPAAALAGASIVARWANRNGLL